MRRETPLHPRPQAFTTLARAVGEECRRLGLRVPGFRSPPGVVGEDRTIRRARDGSALVSVRWVDRPLPAIAADLIEGVVVANGLDHRAARSARAALWTALTADDDPSAGLVAAA